MRGIGRSPDERNRHRLHALALEDLDRRAHVVFVQRRVHRAVGQHALTHRPAQVARHQLRRGGIVGVVAIAFLLVAQADFDAVLVARRAKQADLHALQFDQGVQRHGRAVDAQIAIAHDLFHRLAERLRHLRQAGGDGLRAILRRRCALEEADGAVASGQDEIGERAAGVYAEAILSLHGVLLSGGRGCVACGSRQSRHCRRPRRPRRTRRGPPRPKPARCECRAPPLPGRGNTGRHNRRRPD